MSTEFEIRQFQDGDEQGVLQLLMETFPEWEKRESPSEYYRWKYREAPNGSLHLVMTSSGKIIGTISSVILKIKILDKTYFCRYGDDVAVHKDFRGIGVNSAGVKEIIEMSKKKGLKMGYMIPLTPFVVEFSRKRGRYEFPHETSHMIKVKDVGLHLEQKEVTANKTAAVIGYNLLNKLNRIRNVAPNKGTKSGRLTISSISMFDDRIDQFWEKVKDNYDFIIERKKAWLNWRYAEPKGGKYFISLAEEGGDIKGYIILELRKQADYVEGYITDLLTLPGETEAIEALVLESLNFFDELEVNAVHSRVVKGSSHQAILRKCGFIEAPLAQPMIIFIDWIDDRGEKELLKTSSPERILFSYGDYF